MILTAAPAAAFVAIAVTAAALSKFLLQYYQRDATSRTRPLARSLLSGSAIVLPEAIEHNVADLSDPLEVSDTPFYWHIPKAAGTFIDAFFSECLGLVVANQVGGMFGHNNDKTLKVIHENGGLNYVNVDASSVSGLKRAKSLGLAQSGLADVLISSYAVPAAEVFAPQFRGRMFALFRHPVDRAVSEFYYLQVAEWESTYRPELKAMTLKQYAHGNYIESNWVTRMLVNKLEGEVYEEDLEVAKEILRRKCLVGLVRKMEESIKRFDDFLALDDDDSGAKGRCWHDIIGNGKASNRHDHPALSEGSDEWKMIQQINVFDMQLYEYAEGLFEEQKSLFEDIKDST